jgi:rod shape-determining protein MreC
MDFLKKNGIVVLVAAVLVAVIAIVSIIAGASRSDAAGNTINALMRPVRAVMSSVVSRLEDVYGYMYGYDSLKAENEALKGRIAKLENDYREYQEIAEENKRLHELLGFSEDHSEYQFETATVLSWSSSSWQSSFTIGKGTKSGLAKGNCVITESGFVVGRITSVSASSAVVTTLIDTTSSIGALVWETGEPALLSGDFSLMKEGLAKLLHLPDRSTLPSGETIVTSGSGGVFPRGLVLGTVESVHTDSSGMSDWATLGPSADLNDLAYVYIITSFEEFE